uniref:Photosystem I reaction center subunit VIII n=1 Tax=Renouxia sp. TaxID=2485823 RepID=A0A3G3MHM9_9FLOR|nr:photosystem I subunit VIII [Renouxia sp.]
MIASYLPSILVPLVGILFPGLSMALLFIYIEQETIS